jgi:hypothetical protein
MPVCVAYDRDGKRGDVCSSPGATDLVLPAKACPRWVLPDGDVGPYATQWQEPLERELIVTGWAWLTPKEKAEVFRRIESDELRLDILARDPNGVPGPAAAEFLLSVLPYVPDALRTRFSDWVKVRFAARARTLGMQPARAAQDPEVVALVAALRDSELERQARQLAAVDRDLERWDHVSAIQLAIAADADAHHDLVMQLIDATSTKWSVAQQAASALSYMRTLGPFFEEHLDAFRKLPWGTLNQVFGRTCDRGLLARLEPFLKANANSQTALAVSAAIKRCLSRRDQLEPAFRKWLKSK